MALAFFGSSLVSAQENWLPPPVEAAMVQQFAQRLVEAGFEWESQKQMRSGTEQVVQDMRQYLEEKGETELLADAPQFQSIALPKANQVHLDAMARYNTCILLLYIQHSEREQQDSDARMTAAVGLSALSMTVIYLRQPYINIGGKMIDIENHLTSDAMEQVIQNMQKDPDVRANAEAQCAPFVITFLQSIY